MPGLQRAGERGVSGERASGGEGLLSPAATSELVPPQIRAKRHILDTAEQQVRAQGTIIDERNQYGTSIKYLQRLVIRVFLLQTCQKKKNPSYFSAIQRALIYFSHVAKLWNALALPL